MASPELEARLKKIEDGEAQRLARKNGTARHGALRRAPHLRVDVGIIPHVEGAGRPCPHRDGQKGHGREPGMDAMGGGHKPHESREDDERHDARFQQREIIANRALAASNGGLGIGGIGVDVAHGPLT